MLNIQFHAPISAVLSEQVGDESAHTDNEYLW